MSFDSTAKPFTFTDYTKSADSKAASSTNSSSSAVNPSGDNPEDGEEENEVVENPNIVIEGESLLPTMDVKTGEDEEDVLFVQRCKLFRFTNKEWKERGLGDIKILKHRETSKVRLIMRQERTLKLRANHYLNNTMKLGPSLGNNDKTCTWSTMADFADEEVTPELFAVRFGTTEKAEEFSSIFNQCTSSANNSDHETKQKNEENEDKDLVDKLKSVSVKDE